MGRLASLCFGIALASAALGACGDDDEKPGDTSVPDADASDTNDDSVAPGDSDTVGDSDTTPTLAPCIDDPQAGLEAPPTGGLTCDLIPPGGLTP